jgi:anti-sigma factor RsiW
MDQGGPLTCMALVELVTDYLEGGLPPAEAARFEVHLRDCAHCREYVAQMQLAIRALGHLPADALPAEAMHTLLQHFRDWTRG